MTRVGVRLRAVGIVATACAVAIAGCTDISGSADHVASLEFTALPYPAVVAGDTLRDSLGVVAPLRAIAYNTSGTAIAGAELSYIALDTGLTITSSGLVIAQRRSGTVPIIASSTSLQSTRLSLVIARSPDSVAISKTARDTIDYNPSLPGGTADASDLLEAKIITKDTAGGVTGTQGWLVSYQISFRGALLGKADTSMLFLDDGTRKSMVDTSVAGGLASRRLKMNLGYAATGVDSAIVLATVRYKGQQVRGSPLRFVILLRPK